MRKTKIVCTLGPATDKGDTLREMMLAGMNVARFNFSHGTHAEHKARLEKVKQLREELNLPIATLLDTKGPEIRLGRFKNGCAMLEAGQSFTLTPREVVGDEHRASVSFKNLHEDVHPGSQILVDDGLIELEVTRLHGDEIVTKVLNSGTVKDKKGINVPGVCLSLPYLSPADKADLLFGAAEGFDFVAASFTRSARDVLDIRRLLDENGGEDIRIISKIENQQGISAIDEILAVSGGIMVARGDMGVEIDFTEIPILQKRLIQRCYNSGRPAITATQMLESMMENPRPTRAEITDVANAIYDGTSAIMLSGETAAGKHPVEAVRTMAAIALRTESDISYQTLFKASLSDKNTRLTVTDAVAHATCSTAMDIQADAIITVTQSGETARLLSKYRPHTPIIACTTSQQVCRQLSLSWGICPILMPYAEHTDALIDLSVQAAQNAGLVKDGDLVVITAGVPVGVSGTTNMMKAHLVGNSLLAGVGIGQENAIGRACIVHTPDDLTDHFQPGDILVAPTTSNEMLEAMKQAAAIITEESGLSSHAAIVGLTLGKPVIVGAQGATEKLADGLLVSVDTQHGTVREIPK